MAAVKKTYFFDEAVHDALKAEAKRSGRSVTKQIDFFLRERLGMAQSPGVALYPSTVGAEKRSYLPDPKQKAQRRSSNAR